MPYRENCALIWRTNLMPSAQFLGLILSDKMLMTLNGIFFLMHIYAWRTKLGKIDPTEARVDVV